MFVSGQLDVYGHIGSIDDCDGFLGDSGGVKKVVIVKVIKKSELGGLRRW